uniref:VPS37 C-terminal domain-containing protein n=1 Tax=Periophthalmus magnuspinnatus TaxID=409849 RepID=A0A3B3ZYC6_9GOBI
FQELQVDRENLLMTNRSLAEVSLAQRPRLNTGKVQLADKYQELSNLATSCWDKQSQLVFAEARGHKGSVQSAQNMLQEEVTRAEEQSEELLEKFMEGNLALDDFLDSFQRWRRTYHVRRAQAEKMQELSQAKPLKPCSRTGAEPDPPTATQDNRDSQPAPEPHRPNGFLPQGPLRVFQVRYGLTPAILVPHCPLSPTGSAPCHHPSPTPLPPPLPSTHGPAVGLRLIGQLPGGWASGRPVRVQQLYRPSPAHTEPPCR